MSEKNVLNKFVEEVYTSIDEASDIIKARWLDSDLRKRVESKLKGGVPEMLNDGPSGAIWRQVGTPDGEFVRFLELNKRAGLKPVCLEFLHDKYTGRNFTKYALTNFAIFNGLNKNSQNMIVRRKIINFDNVEGKQLLDMKTLWGEGLVDFHHFFLQEIFPIMKNRVIDISEWARKQGETPKEYYPAVLSLALCHFVFFEDIDLIKNEMTFANEVIVSAFNSVKKEFGLKPIIVRISTKEEQSRNPYWSCYSKDAEDIMSHHVKSYAP